MRECGVVERLSDTTRNALINITTIFLGLGVGSKLLADKFLNVETLGILFLGIIAFSIGTASRNIDGKADECIFIYQGKPADWFSRSVRGTDGRKGVSGYGSQGRPSERASYACNGPNVAGVVGSAVAAGMLLAVFQ